MRRKKLSFTLMVIILLSSVIISCRDKRAEKLQTDTSETIVREDSFNVPKGICEGEEIDIYLAMPIYKNSYIAEEETGDELNDAVLLRNNLVEEHTGAKINFTLTTTNGRGTDQNNEATKIRTLIQAGDDTYEAYIHAQRTDLFTSFMENLFVDWYTIPYINLENPWWYSNVLRDSTYGGKLFAMTGDYNLTSFSYTECLLFNKTMCDELGLEYPYKMVFDGTWTHDKFVQYIKAATKDVNGDGKIEYISDRMGYGGYMYEQIPALFVGYGGDCLVKDENNLPVLVVDSEHNYTVIDKILEVFDLDGARYFQISDGGAHNNAMFNEGRLLFNDCFFNSIPATRQLENIDIGFVPYPKIDTDQKDYYSRTANLSGLTYIPVTNNKLDATGAVLETMAYYSGDTVLKTYFDNILTIKSTRDIESEEMIPIIRNSSRFEDIMIVFDGIDIVLANSGNTLASTMASKGDIWELTVEQMVEFYEE